jgi:predicted transglutaminase-like cysteine proteinase
MFASILKPSLARQHALCGRVGQRLLAGFVLAAWLGSMAMAWVLAAPDAERMSRAAQALGPSAVAGSQALLTMLSGLDRTDERGLLEAVNRFFNRRVAFREDAQVWGQTDYWASPLETLHRGAGDCEDFALAKYFTLLSAGVSAERMRMVYVRARIGGPSGLSQAHMVLAYYPAAGAEPLILDNLIDDIRPSSRRPDLTPVFSFNTEGLWQGVGAASAGDPTARLSRWREVLVKARQEGFLP